MQDSLIKQIEIMSWGALSLLTVSSFVLSSLETTLGFVVGGVISILNFRWLSFFLRRMLLQSDNRMQKWVKISYFFRYLVVFLILLFSLRQHLVTPIPLLVGLSMIVFGVGLSAVWAIIHNQVK